MILTQLITEDFVNFKKPSMFLSTSVCSFKCDKEKGCQICQNSSLAAAPKIEVDDLKIIKNYIKNDITEAIVIGGLEGFDTFEEVLSFINKFRAVSNDQIVIYTGYYPSEIKDKLKELYDFKNIIVKFGRFIPNDTPRYDEILGVTLASSNQFALDIEEIKKQLEV